MDPTVENHSLNQQPLNLTPDNLQKPLVNKAMHKKFYFFVLIVIFIAIISVGFYIVFINKTKELTNKKSIEKSNLLNSEDFSTVLIFSKTKYSSSGHHLQSEVASYNLNTKQNAIVISDTTGNKSFNAVEWFGENKKLIINAGDLSYSAASGSGSIFDNPNYANADLSTGKINKVDNLPKEFVSADFATSLANNEVYYVLGKDNFIQVGIYNQITHNLKTLYSIPKNQVTGITDWRDLAFSSDKTKLLYDTFGMGAEANVYLLDLQTGISKELTSGSSDTSVKWIDDSNIVFNRRDNKGKDSIWIYNVNSGESRQVLGKAQGVDATNSYDYKIIPNRKEIIFKSNKTVGSYTISVIDLNTNEVKDLISLSKNEYDPVANAEISLDGKYVAFVANNGGIYIYDLMQKKINLVYQSSATEKCGLFELSGYNGAIF